MTKVFRISQINKSDALQHNKIKTLSTPKGIYLCCTDADVAKIAKELPYTERTFSLTPRKLIKSRPTHELLKFLWTVEGISRVLICSPSLHPVTYIVDHESLLDVISVVPSGEVINILYGAVLVRFTKE